MKQAFQKWTIEYFRYRLLEIRCNVLEHDDLDPSQIMLAIHPLAYAAYVLRTGNPGISQKILRTKYDRPSSRRLTFKPAGKGLIPTDPTLEDHFYTSSEYKSMFKRHGFTAERIHRSRSTFQSFILR